MIGLGTPLSKITSIGPRFLKGLLRLDIKTVGDLIRHLPSRYEDFSQIYKIYDLEPGQQATIQGIVKRVELRRSWRKKMTIVEAWIEDETGEIRAIWFNQPYLKNILRAGKEMSFSGKVSLSDNEIYLSHPDHEAVTLSKNEAETRHTGRLVPIYPETRGLTSRAIRFIIQPILKNLASIPEFLPDETLEKEGLPEINEAIRKIHFPESDDQVEKIKKRFAFENIFLLQLFNLKQRLEIAKQRRVEVRCDKSYLERVLKALPFKLTAPQQKSLKEIIDDLAGSSPMNRLLQGDVGSGKTIVAAIASLIVAKAGKQAAFMAPTEVLAKQHFKTLKGLFEKLEKKLGEEFPELGIITSSEAKIVFAQGLESDFKKAEFKKKTELGEVKIIIGTHALIEKNLNFNDLALVVVDEQHRFGVRQRAELLNRGEKASIIPHFLSMSATPIPRTMMMAMFGNLDVSIIDELPLGRKEIITKIVSPDDRIKAYGFIKGQVLKGRQAFVICPRIEPSANTEGLTVADLRLWEVKSVKAEYEKLSKKVFPEFKVGMLHGQLKPKEKTGVMSEFSAGKIDILVSTSVVEVGVDVPNATIIMIEGAEKFGLAQLYQFRGRVGRGEYQSFCFLFTDSGSDSTKNRLKAILEAKNGFELAERDLKLRGPGQFLGESQTGIPDVAMEAIQDMRVVKSAQDAAVEILKKDPELKRNIELKKKLGEFSKKIHEE